MGMVDQNRWVPNNGSIWRSPHSLWFHTRATCSGLSLTYFSVWKYLVWKSYQLTRPMLPPLPWTAWIQLPSIPYKRFENLVGKLRHTTLGIPTNKDLCVPFNCTIHIQPTRVALRKQGIIHWALHNWIHILVSTGTCPTHLNELVIQESSDIGNMSASAEGVDGVIISVTSEYSNIAWRVQRSKDITNTVISDTNPSGTITNPGLEMTVILVQWIVVLEEMSSPHHLAILTYSDIAPSMSWVTRMSPKSKMEVDSYVRWHYANAPTRQLK